jgi:hypothetical protein
LRIVAVTKESRIVPYFDDGRREKVNGKDRTERKRRKMGKNQKKEGTIRKLRREFVSAETQLTSKCLDKIARGFLGTDKIYAYFKISFVISCRTHHSNCPTSS